MKQLFALISAAIFALSNNLEIIQPERKFYDTNNLYNTDGNSGQVIDHTAIFNTFYGVNFVSSNQCDNTYRKQGANPYRPNNADVYWFLPTGQKGYEEYKAEDTIAADTEITCPFDAVVVSSLTSAEGANGTLAVQSKDGEYTITLTNMKRIYCCMNKPQAETYFHSKTGHSAPNDVISAGSVLGETTADTQITLTRKGEKVDIITLYS
jgi:hypothetical protein